MGKAPKTISSVWRVFFPKLAEIPSVEGSVCRLTGRQFGAEECILQPGRPGANPRVPLLPGGLREPSPLSLSLPL